jgi:RNA polymerase sigma-70 factor, ECF subfamily
MQRDLVLRASAGDHVAFTALITDLHDRLHRTARLILRSDDEASDAVQDALIAAWVHIRAVRDPDRFEAWLHRLLVHACYRHGRRAKRRQITELHITPPDPIDSSDMRGQTELRDELDRGFRRLTAQQRAVLVVHHYLGLPDRDAAVVLDIPVGTYKSRLHRAATALRAELEADDRTATLGKESIA